jgi:hypothetical protein
MSGLNILKWDVIEKMSKLFIDCGGRCEDVHARLVIIQLP